MTPIRHILVATDFGAASTRAIEVATEIASSFGAKMTVLHTIEEPSLALPCHLPPEIRQAAAFRLNGTVKGIGRRLSSVEGMLCEGLAWNEITRTAPQIGADLVVVGSHGPRGGYRYLVGSVAEKVVRVCTVPVLTVHPWRFDDRTHAGRELAELLLQSDEQAPAVVALSRGGAMIAAEVAEGFGVLPQLLLTGVLRHEGRPLGAACEDGTVYFDNKGDRAFGELQQADAERVLAALMKEEHRLRGHRWTDDGRVGTIVLVDDAIVSAAPIVVAAQVLRRMGAHRLIAATPVASVTARKAITKVVDALVVLQVIEDGVPIEGLYRDRSTPTDQAVARRLATATQWAHAVERHP